MRFVHNCISPRADGSGAEKVRLERGGVKGRMGPGMGPEETGSRQGRLFMAGSK
jgi:hypothetical protein